MRLRYRQHGQVRWQLELRKWHLAVALGVVALISSFYGSDLKERRPVRLEEVPEELVLSILAAEDARFFEHGGISVLGILRAAVLNMRSGAIRQGGSTLTQQLVKNLFLTQART